MKKFNLSKDDRIIILAALELYEIHWQDHYYAEGEKERIAKLIKRIYL